MTLKTDFYLGATGLHEQMNDVFDQGVDFVTDNLSTLQTALTDNAAKGITNFTATIATAFEPANLRLNGLHWQHYRAGIVDGLAAEDIYSHEVTIELNTSDTTVTSIDFNFTL